MSALTRIILRLARNPDAGFPDGDQERGYVIVAPLDPDHHLDAALWRTAKDQCTVVRFSPDPDEQADGRLLHRGQSWYFHYDEAREGPDEPVYKLADHRLEVGEYVTVREAAGDALTYRVTEAVRLHATA
jgi:hypothetical protein